MSKNIEKLTRDVLAALIGSKLTVAEIRLLAESLERDRNFRHELSNLLMEISMRLGTQSELNWQESAESEADSPKYGGLTDLAYSVVQRKRISKAKLLSLFSMMGVDARMIDVSSDVPIREIVYRFLEFASPKQLEEFMSYLGLDVQQDAYLGIIGRSRGY